VQAGGADEDREGPGSGRWSWEAVRIATANEKTIPMLAKVRSMPEEILPGPVRDID